MFRFVSFRGRAQVLLAAVGALPITTAVVAGPYSGPTDTTHAIDPAIASGSSVFQEWADAIDPTRTAFAPNGSTSIDQVGGINSLGDLDESQINNGDPVGFLTVTFPNGIRNGSGADFAIFENGFIFPGDPYLNAELAYVEVSSNGTDFARFQSISTNTSFEGDFGQGFGGFDTTNIYNLAGKHGAGFGTPFDLDDLLTDPLVIDGDVDLEDIQYVRLVDIPGNGAFLDSLDNPILDAWLTTGTGGYDFALGEGSGVGVINAVPEPTSAALLALAGMAVMRRRRA
ncbi:MAG: PEP-CTERM sorting domain-containing protein [Phycisphaeraceae bacterium]|nr:PEP-CTERM sorting domain-containing protein [Phycisphaeraceae bacterium]